jgi:hypothetical protein
MCQLERMTEDTVAGFKCQGLPNIFFRMQFHLLFLYKIKVSKQNKNTHTYICEKTKRCELRKKHTHINR